MKCGFSLALVCVLAPLAAAQHYDVTDLGSMTPVGINVWGQVAGNLNNHAVTWTKSGIRDLGVLPGGTFSEAAAINDLGMVAGTADGQGTIYDPDQAYPPAECPDLIQPFVWSPRNGFTVMSPFPVASRAIARGGWDCNQSTYSTAMNLHGQVTAYNLYIDTYMEPYFWDGSNGAGILPGPDYADTANAINDFAMVAGQGGVLPDISVGVIWNNGTEAYLPDPSTAKACAGADSINDLGEIVGWTEIVSNSILEEGTCLGLGDADHVPIHAMLWKSSTVSPMDLGTLPDDLLSMAVKINNLGVVIGTSGNSVFTSYFRYPFFEVVGRPFIWDRIQGMRDLNGLIPRFSGWTLQSVSDINGLGQIVGTGSLDGKTHGFLLTPRFF